MHPLFQLLVRILCGERLEKATPQDYRLWFGIFGLFPLAIGSVMLVGNTAFFDRMANSSLTLYPMVMGSAVVSLAVGAAWTKYVPARVSLVLGLVLWAATLWLWWRTIG